MSKHAGTAFLAAFLLLPGPCWAQQTIVLPESAFQAVGLERRWVTVLPVGGLQDRVRAATVVEDLAAVQTVRGSTHVLNVETGQLLYSIPGQATVREQPAFAVNSEAVFTFKGPTLYRFNRDTGVEEWRIYLDQVPWSPLVANEDYVYYGTLEGRLYAKPTRLNVPGIRKWFAQLYAPVDSSPLAHLEWVVAGSRDGLVYVFPSRSSNVVFRYRTDGAVTSSPVAHQTNLFVASEDGYVYSIDIRNGATFWRYPVAGAVKEPMLLALTEQGQPELLVVNEDARLFCLDALTGEEKWTTPGVVRLVAASKQRLYVQGRVGELRILQRSDGGQISALPVRDIALVHNGYSDRILLVSKSGIVTMAAEPGAATPTYHRSLSRPTPAPSPVPSGQEAVPATQPSP